MKPNYLIIAITLLFTGCLGDRLALASKHDVPVFEKEEYAAYGGSAVKPVAIIQKGEEVSVLVDTYGKDYWACKVKLKNNVTGWVLCTNLSFQNGI